MPKTVAGDLKVDRFMLPFIRKACEAKAVVERPAIVAKKLEEQKKQELPLVVNYRPYRWDTDITADKSEVTPLFIIAFSPRICCC